MNRVPPPFFAFVARRAGTLTPKEQMKVVAYLLSRLTRAPLDGRILFASPPAFLLTIS